MLSDELFLIIRLIRKISAITLACLLGLNLAAGAVVVAEPCPSSMCCCDPRDMDHRDSLLNFAFSLQECFCYKVLARTDERDQLAHITYF